MKNYPERKRAFWIFLATLILVAFFWLKANGKDIWDKIYTPSIYEIFPVTSGVNHKGKEEIQTQINNLTRKLIGTYGVYVYSFATGEEFGQNFDDFFPAASLNKIPIMLDFYRTAEKGAISLNTIYALKEEDIQDYGTGSIRYEEPGKKYTYEELLELSGKQSDNTAAHILDNILSKQHVNLFLKTLGFQKTSMDENLSTPKEIGQMFVKTYNGEILKKKSFLDKFYSALSETDFEDRLVKGFPDNTKVSHKIGSGDRAYSDCGLVFAENPFVLCLMSKDASEDEALAVMPKIAKLVWVYLR